MSDQTYFEVLGLDAPPADRRAIKRAYSKMLKVTRPEDDPDGFMRLRDAHDFALQVLEQDAQDLTYATMIEDAAEPVPTRDDEPEDTSYAIGGPRGFDIPDSVPEAKPEPQDPPLYEELKSVINDPDARNDRNAWNRLFRAAKELDIDAYVDFENMVLEAMLQVQGFYDYNDPNHNMPERMGALFEPSITASMFRTLSWDQVSKHDGWKAHRIDWLERRMGYREADPNSGVQPVPAPTGMSRVWSFLFIAFLIAQALRLIFNS